jgi:hypothetical protein
VYLFLSPVVNPLNFSKLYSLITKRNFAKASSRHILIYWRFGEVGVGVGVEQSEAVSGFPQVVIFEVLFT